MKLEYPLIDALPSVEHSRDRLLARIFRYRQDEEASRSTTDEDFALIYAYSMSSHLFLLGRAYTDRLQSWYRVNWPLRS